jgi:hypothetical protein
MDSAFESTFKKVKSQAKDVGNVWVTVLKEIEKRTIGILDRVTDLTKENFKLTQDIIKNQVENQINALEESLERGEITQKEFDAKSKEIRKEQWEREKRFSRSQAELDFWGAIAEAYREGGVLAAITSVPFLLKQRELTLKKIDTQPAPFQQGGVIKGLNEQMGNENGIISVQNGEAILNRRAVLELGESTINRLNKGEPIAPDVSIVVNSNNGSEVVDVLNDYFRQFGTSERGVSL